MEVRQVNLQGANLDGKLPEWVKMCLDKENCYCFTASEDDICLGTAVFQQSSFSKTEMVLKYVYVDSAERRQGIGTELIERSEEKLKESGVTHVVCRHVGDSETLETADSFLFSADYEKLSEGYYLEYEVKSLLDSALGKQMDKLKPLTSKVQFYDQIDKKARKAFKVKLAENNINFDEKKFDRLFSRFYVDNKQIGGFINLTEVVDNKLLLTDVFIDEGKDKKFLIPAMLASILTVASAMLEENAAVFFQLFDETLYNGVVTVFGKPLEGLFIHEYMHRL